MLTSSLLIIETSRFAFVAEEEILDYNNRKEAVTGEPKAPPCNYKTGRRGVQKPGPHMGTTTSPPQAGTPSPHWVISEERDYNHITAIL